VRQRTGDENREWEGIWAKGVEKKQGTHLLPHRRSYQGGREASPLHKAANKNITQRVAGNSGEGEKKYATTKK